MPFIPHTETEVRQMLDAIGVASIDELFDEIPENLRCYVDYEAFSRDLFINDCYSVDCPEGGVHVFRNC